MRRFILTLMLVLMSLGLSVGVVWAACDNPPGGYGGFGGSVTGGAGQPIYHVTNLNNSGPGSLRGGLGVSNRCIVFDVYGEIITTTDQLNISGSNITIDGNSAPSPGITIHGHGFNCQGAGSHDFIVRGLRVRTHSWDGEWEIDGFECFTGSSDADRPYNIVITGNSFASDEDSAGLTDGVVDLVSAHHVTVSWNILSHFSHSSDSHGTLAQRNSDSLTYHHNFLTRTNDRKPLIVREGSIGPTSVISADIRNNLVTLQPHGTGSRGIEITDQAKVNVVNNYIDMEAGTANSDSRTHLGIWVCSTSMPSGDGVYGCQPGWAARAYITGNVAAFPIPSQYPQNYSDWSTEGSPFSFATVSPTTDATTAACAVKNQVGPFPRDVTDLDMIASIRPISGCGVVSLVALNITKSGGGSGVVASAPSGINCGSTCNANFNSGTNLTLSATPIAGSVFGGWSGGGCSGTGTCNITLNSNTTVNASFTQSAPLGPTYYVRANGTASGCVANTDTVAGSRNTIQGGANCATGPGDTIIVHGGTYGSYSDQLTIPNLSGSNFGSGAITIKAANNETVWQLGRINSWESTNAYWIIDGINFDMGYVGYDRSGTVGTYMRLQNLEYKRSPHIGLLALPGSEFNHVISHDHGNCAGAPAADCWCTGAGGAGQCHAFYMHDTPWIVENSEGYNTHGHGVAAVYDATSGNTSYIRNNKFHDCADPSGCNGIQMIQTNGTVQVYNNQIYNYTLGSSSAMYIDTAGSSSRVYNFYNNTFYGNREGLVWNSSTVGETRNNIFSQTGSPGITGTASNNMTAGDPGFNGAPAGDFHLACAGCPSVGTGVNLSSVFTTDAEGIARPGGSTPWDLGALTFTAGTIPPNPNPGTIVGLYTFDEGTGTAVHDTASGSPANDGTWTECSANGCWTAGIIGPFAGNFNGSRSVSISDTTGLHPTAAIALAANIRMTTTGPAGCDVLSIGDSAAARVYPDGNVAGIVFNGSTWTFPISTLVNALNGTNHLLSMSYDASNIRVYLDANQVAMGPASGLINYGLGSTVTIGRHGNGSPDYACTGVIDQVYILNGFCDAACMLNLYNAQVPVAGMSIAHTAWYQTGTPGTQLGSLDTDLPSWPITTPLAMAFYVRKADAGSLTEYFRPMCIANTGAGFPAWTSALEVTNSFPLGGPGVRYYADAAITQGQASPLLLPTEGFTGIAGKVLRSPIDTTSPYDAVQRVTIAQGQQAVVQLQLEFGPPLVATNQVQCRLVRENGTDFSGGYSGIAKVTLTGIAAPTSVKIGGISEGGTKQ